MKHFTTIRFIIFTLVVAVLVNFGIVSQTVLSAETASTKIDQGDYPYNVFLPLIKNDLSPVIPQTTNVLTEETMEHLSSVSNDGSTFTFDDNTLELNAVESGEIMVGDSSTLAPNGFLRKVTSVQSTNGAVVVTTEPATLEEAIEQGNLQISRQLKPSDVQQSINMAGVTLQSGADAVIEDKFFINIKDVVLYDNDGNLNTTGDQIKANGSVELAPDFDFSLAIRDWELEELTIINTTKETATLEIVTETEVELFDEEVELARYYFTPITVFVGTFPVVFQPVLTVNVGVDGSIYIGATTSVTQEATLKAGLQYENKAWHEVSDFSNTFTFNPPTLSAGLDMKGYTGANVTLLLYGVTGTYVEVNAYLKLEADVLATPWWELYAGLDIPAGVKIEIFSHTIAGYEANVLDNKKLLAQAAVDDTNYAPNIPSNPSPGSNVAPGAVVLSWDGGDPNGDTVVYDLYMASVPCNINCWATPSSESFNLVAGDLAQPTYSNGYASFDWMQYWKIVARDEHGLESVGPIWRFYGDPCLDGSFPCG